MTSTAKTAARREAIVLALLVIVGAVLAFVLFAAGALWRGRSSAERPKTSISTPAEKTGAELKKQHELAAAALNLMPDGCDGGSCVQSGPQLTNSI